MPRPHVGGGSGRCWRPKWRELSCRLQRVAPCLIMNHVSCVWTSSILLFLDCSKGDSGKDDSGRRGSCSLVMYSSPDAAPSRGGKGSAVLLRSLGRRVTGLGGAVNGPHSVVDDGSPGRPTRGGGMGTGRTHAGSCPFSLVAMWGHLRFLGGSFAWFPGFSRPLSPI